MQTITLNKSKYHLYLDDSVFINQNCDLINVRNITENVRQSSKTGDYHLCWANHRSNVTLEYFRAKENQEDCLIVDNSVFYKIKSIPRENNTKLVHIFSDRQNCYALNKISLSFKCKNYKNPVPLESKKLKSIFHDSVTYFDNEKLAYKSQIAKLHSIVNTNAQTRA